MATAQDLNQALSELSKYTREELEDMTVMGLRKKLQAVKVSHITRGDKEVPIVSAKKKELVDAVLAVTAKDKVLQLTVPELTPEDMEKVSSISKEADEIGETDYSGIADWAYETMRKYVEKRWDKDSQTFLPPDGTLAALAGGVRVQIERKHPDINGELKHHTRLNARTSILKTVRRMIDQNDGNTWIYNQMVNAHEEFRKFVFLETKADSLAKKEHGDKQDDERDENRSEINISRLVAHSYDVLAHLTPETPATQWKEVALALAFTTGRRVFSEIFTSAEFEQVSDHEVMFTGQAKTKGKSAERYEENPSYPIPTLVPAHLVVSALKWLGDKGKRIRISDYSDIQLARVAANRRFSKELSAYTPTWVSRYVEVTKESDKPKDITSHTFRELYALAACKAFGGFSKYEVKYAAKILGHHKDDDSTAQKYQKDFVLHPDSKVCI